MVARDLNKRELLMLAGTFDPEDELVGSWYMSEKLDGMRCFWDGGISTGLFAGDVPYANCVNEGAEHISTGLWSRGGKVVHAPKWLTAQLPRGTLLDGELWNSKMKLQDIVSVTRSHDKDAEWTKLHYMVFDSPSHPQFFRGGRIHMGDWEAQLPDMKDWAVSHGIDWSDKQPLFSEFVKEYVHGKHAGCNWDVLEQHFVTDLCKMNRFLNMIVKRDGEGIMLRRADSVWNPRRDRESLLKVKKFYDSEANIVDFTSGKITKKDSRLRGKLGALIVEEIGTGHRFEIAGLNDSERDLCSDGTWVWDHPGEELPAWITSASFEVGQRISFKFWDRTKDGIPKFAVYWRDKVDE